MTHGLDRPVWNALATVHSGVAEGDDRARRFVPSICPFAATLDDTPESLASLGRLARGGGPMVGDVPNLHAHATNTAAIRLYESIGFRVRSTFRPRG